MTSRALVLQHAAPEGPGRIASALALRGIGTRAVRTDRGEKVPDDVADAPALVVMGGPMGVYEAGAFPYLRAEMRLVEGALAAGVPVLGVCLGSQILAHVLGARVAPAGRPEIGWHPVALTPEGRADALLGTADGCTPLHWHGDVFTLPGGAVPLARSAQTPLQAFRYDGAVAPAYGLLFHLEATPAIARGMASLFADEARGAGADPERLAGESPARLAALRPVARRVFGAWADLVAARGA